MNHGTAYLDVEWEYGLVLEIDGIHHLGARAVVAGALRQNEITLGATLRNVISTVASARRFL